MEIKIGIVSDLHAEFWNENHFEGVGERVRQELGDADLILLAGDIDNGRNSILTAKRLFPAQTVCLVAGNHEYYQQDYLPTLQMLRDEAKDSNVHFLYRDVFETELYSRNIRVLGVTLWTDFQLFGDRTWNMIEGGNGLNDFRLIRYQGHRLTPQDTVDMHNEDKAWLLNELEKPFDGITIVLTHHAPVSFASAPRFVNDALSPCFASKLEETFARDDIALVVWGHTHHSVDQVIGTTRFVSNQTGYVTGRAFVETDNFGKIVTI